jgi:HNH endonuclease/Homing endonuclease associated repeat
MSFQLKPDNRNAADKDLISDLVSVAKKVGKDSVTRNEYNKHGRFSEGTLRKRFGGWLKALEAAGLPPTKQIGLTDMELIDELKRVANLPEVEVLTREAFNEHRKLSNTSTYERRFGSWNNALEKAGIKASRSQRGNLSNIELFENLLRVWTLYGRQPTITEMGYEPSVVTGATYKNRFGGWRKALEAFVEYANGDEPETTPHNETGDLDIIDEGEEVIRHETSRTVNLRLRFLVMQRDNFKCKICGRSPATEPTVKLHIDHIHPWSKGGETVLENLQTLCSKCNLGKSDIC